MLVNEMNVEMVKRLITDDNSRYNADERFGLASALVLLGLVDNDEYNDLWNGIKPD